MRNTIISSINNNNNSKKIYNSKYIYHQMSSNDLSTILMKPAVSAAAILVAKAALKGNGGFMQNLQNLQQSDYALAGGVGAGFLVAKYIGPMIQQNLHLGTFFGAFENRVVEVAGAGGALYALDKSKMFGQVFPTNQGDLITTAVIITIADMLGEEAPVFFGIHK
jgi:hypothetical protein